MRKPLPSLLKLSPPRLFGVLGLSLLLAASAAALEDTLDKSFPVQPGGQLVVDVDRGSLDVKTADAAAVEVRVTRKVSGAARKAQELLQEHQVTFTQDGNRVEVRARGPKRQLGGWLSNLWGGWRGLQVAYEITVPPQFNVDLKTAGGAVKVAGLMGKVQAQTAGGSLRFRQIEGPIQGQTSGGSIKAAECKGTVNIRTSGGGIDLEGINGDVTAHTSGGSIDLQKINGQANVETSGGGIDVAEVKGPIAARTSGGGISASLADALAGDCSFKTSGGSITIVLAEKAAVDVNARTSGGRVVSDLPVTSVIQGEAKRNVLEGKINGGGPKLTAHTSGGNIHLRKK